VEGMSRPRWWNPGPRRQLLAVSTLLVLVSGLFANERLKAYRQRQWASEVQELGIAATVVPISKWTSELSVPAPMSLFDHDVVIVHLDDEADRNALLTKSSDCPADVKIYAFRDMSAARHGELEQRFPSAVVFTRIDQ
jgi:hypothetical protein